MGYKILDHNEYKYHKRKFKYSSDIDKIVNKELAKLIQMKKNKEGPFDKNNIIRYQKIYNNIINNT